jgi:hypothetical protein
MHKTRRRFLGNCILTAVSGLSAGIAMSHFMPRYEESETIVCDGFVRKRQADKNSGISLLEIELYNGEKLDICYEGDFRPMPVNTGVQVTYRKVYRLKNGRKEFDHHRLIKFGYSTRI